MKKAIIISIIAFTIIVLILMILVNRAAKKQTAQSSFSSVAAPAVETIPQLPNTEPADINPQNLTGSIQENISKLKSSNQPNTEIQFKASQEQKPTATLDQFQSSSGIKIYPSVLSNLKQDEYSIFSCANQPGSAADLGIIVRFKEGDTAAYYANLYSQMNKNLLTWESTLFKDISPLFFPGKKISQTPIFKSTKYTTENGAADIDIRFGEIKSDDGTEISVYYAVYNEDVYIFDSSKCLGEALDKYEPVLEP